MGKIKMGKKKTAQRLCDSCWANVDANISDPILQHVAVLLKSSSKRRAPDVSTSGKPLNDYASENAFVIGLRCVLKHLEDGKLAVALFDHEKWPDYFYYHVGVVSANSCTHCCQVKNLSTIIAPILGLHSARAFGIKNSSNDEILLLINRIKSQLPQISVVQSDFLTYFQ